MSRRTISWGKLQAVLKDHGVRIGVRGSEAKLVKVIAGGKPIIYILQHECCRSASSTVWATHFSRIKRKFAMSDADFD